MRAISALACALLVGAAPPAFTKKPTVTRAGDKVKIEFAVDRETDVAVFIEDGNGKVVRHLVAGVLGKNPPAPLKPGLAQSLEWDGKADYGRPAGAGPFKVRVALGLGARYDKVLISDPMAIGNVTGLATGPDGTLYAVVGAGATIPNWGSRRLVALNRDGTFQRTVIPPPSSATKEQIAVLGGVPVEVGGRTVPLVIGIATRRNTAFEYYDGMAMTPDGALLVNYPIQGGDHAFARIGMIDVTGSKTPPPFAGPGMFPKFPKASFRGDGDVAANRAGLASSSDGKYAFFSGINPIRLWGGAKARWSAVYRVKLPERTPAEPFFGDPDKPGNDETHLGTRLGGLATDGKGTLLVCDVWNNRVVAVSEADGKFAGALTIEAPQLVAADHQTGAVYVLKSGKGGTAELLKFASWKEPKPTASVSLGAFKGEPQRSSLAADASARPAVLWVSDGLNLHRIEDLGGKFGDARNLMADKGVRGSWDDLVSYPSIGDGGFVGISVDHWRDDPEVYWRGYPFYRYQEGTGKIEAINVQLLSGASGPCLEPAPDGNLYVLGYPHFLYKFDRNGKNLTWEVPWKFDGTKTNHKPPEPLPTHAIYMASPMGYLQHTLGIRGDGHIFVFEQSYPDYRPAKMLREYLPGGQRVSPDPVVWKGSDTVIGPKFDQQGNIYVAEQIKPLDRLVPQEFAGYVGPVKLGGKFGSGDPRGNPLQMYGSIVKFSPKGGTFDWPGAGDGVLAPNPFAGQPKLDPALKSMDMATCIGSDERALIPAKVVGAEWVHMGISHVELFYCNCENVRFDVDPFGRVWYPDTGRYRVGVLDTNGNEITAFGGYGNAESMGPESPVIDPKTKQVRPRKADDPKDLKSPFAEPEIAFSWLVGVGATDRYAYMGDGMNRRLLRAKLVYAAEETCPVQ